MFASPLLSHACTFEKCTQWWKKGTHTFKRVEAISVRIPLPSRLKILLKIQNLVIFLNKRWRIKKKRKNLDDVMSPVILLLLFFYNNYFIIGIFSLFIIIFITCCFFLESNTWVNIKERYICAFCLCVYAYMHAIPSFLLSICAVDSQS